MKSGSQTFGVLGQYALESGGAQQQGDFSDRLHRLPGLSIHDQGLLDQADIVGGQLTVLHRRPAWHR